MVTGNSERVLLLRVVGDVSTANDDLSQLRSTIQGAGGDVQGLNDRLSQLGASASGLGSAAGGASDKVDDLDKKTRSSGDGAKSAESEFTALKGAVSELSQLVPGLSGGLSQVEHALSTVGQQAKEGQSQLALIGGGITAIGVGVAALSFEAFDKGVESIHLLAVQTGMTTDAVGGLRLGFQEQGQSADAANTALMLVQRNLQTLNQQLDAGKTPTGTFATALESIGIASSSAAVRSNDLGQLLPMIADRFQATKAQADASGVSFNATGLAMELFGRRGAAMVPILEQGSAGLAKNAEYVKSLGLADDEQVAHLEAWNTASARAQTAVLALGASIGSDVAPVLTTLASAVGGATAALDQMPAPVKDLAVSIPLIGGGAIVAIAGFEKLTATFGSSVTTIRSAITATTDWVVAQGAAAGASGEAAAGEGLVGAAATTATPELLAAADAETLVAAGEGDIAKAAPEAAAGETLVGAAGDTAAAGGLAAFTKGLGAAALAAAPVIVFMGALGAALVTPSDGMKVQAQSASDLAQQHAQLIAMLDREIAAHGSTTKAANDLRTALEANEKAAEGNALGVQGATNNLNGFNTVIANTPGQINLSTDAIDKLYVSLKDTSAINTHLAGLNQMEIDSMAAADSGKQLATDIRDADKLMASADAERAAGHGLAASAIESEIEALRAGQKDLAKDWADIANQIESDDKREASAERQVADATHQAIMDRLNDKLILAAAEQKIADSGGSLSAEEITAIRNTAQEQQTASDKQIAASKALQTQQTAAAKTAQTDADNELKAQQRLVDDTVKNDALLSGSYLKKHTATQQSIDDENRMGQAAQTSAATAWTAYQGYESKYEAALAAGDSLSAASYQTQANNARDSWDKQRTAAEGYFTQAQTDLDTMQKAAETEAKAETTAVTTAMNDQTTARHQAFAAQIAEMQDIPVEWKNALEKAQAAVADIDGQIAAVDQTLKSNLSASDRTYYEGVKSNLEGMRTQAVGVYNDVGQAATLAGRIQQEQAAQTVTANNQAIDSAKALAAAQKQQASDAQSAADTQKSDAEAIVSAQNALQKAQDSSAQSAQKQATTTTQAMSSIAASVGSATAEVDRMYAAMNLVLTTAQDMITLSTDQQNAQANGAKYAAEALQVQIDQVQSQIDQLALTGKVDQGLQDQLKTLEAQQKVQQDIVKTQQDTTTANTQPMLDNLKLQNDQLKIMEDHWNKIKEDLSGGGSGGDSIFKATESQIGGGGATPSQAKSADNIQSALEALSKAEQKLADDTTKNTEKSKSDWDTYQQNVKDNSEKAANSAQAGNTKIATDQQTLAAMMKTVLGPDAGGAFPAVATSAQTAANTISTSIGTSIGKDVPTATTTAGTSLHRHVEQDITPVGAAYGKMHDDTVAAVTGMSTDIPPIMTTVGTGISDPVAQAATDVNTSMGTLSTNINDSLTTEAPIAATNAETIGAAIDGGVAQGITNHKDEIATSLVNAINDAIASTKVTIQAQSPSQVTADQIGLPMAQGVAQGVTEGAGSVQTAMQGLVTGGVQAGASAAASGAGGGGGTPAGYRPNYGGDPNMYGNPVYTTSQVGPGSVAAAAGGTGVYGTQTGYTAASAAGGGSGMVYGGSAGAGSGDSVSGPGASGPPVGSGQAGSMYGPLFYPGLGGGSGGDVHVHLDLRGAVVTNQQDLRNLADLVAEPIYKQLLQQNRQGPRGR